MNAVEVKELSGAEAFDALGSTLELAPRPDDAERLRLAQVFPTRRQSCDIPLKIAGAIAHFASDDSPVHAMLEKARGIRHA